MSKKEFLATLREALAGEIPEREIANQLEYYKSYISNSTSEKKALEELGEPRLIARTIIASYTASKGPMADYYTKQAREEYSDFNRAREQQEEYGSARDTDREPTWYEKVLWVVAAIALVGIIFAVFFTLFHVMMWLIPPLLIVIMMVTVIRHLFDDQ